MFLPKRWRKRITVNAVHDEDLERVLRDLGIFDDLVSGRLRCRNCDCVVGLSNLGAVLAEDGAVRVACMEKACAATDPVQGEVARGNVEPAGNDPVS